MRQVRGRRLSVIDREETLNLDEIKPVKNKKDRNEGVEDEADNHDHIEDLRVFMAIVGVHVLESLPHVEKQSYISTGFRKESSFFGFLVFYFFLDKLDFLVYSPVNFLSSLPYRNYSLGVEKWINSKV